MSTPILFLALAMAIALLAQLWAVVWTRAAVRDLDRDNNRICYILQRVNELTSGAAATKNTDVLHGAQLRGAGERIRTLEAEVAALARTVDTLLQGNNQ